MSRSELVGLRSSPRVKAAAELNKSVRKSEAGVTLFLSHSHSDQDLVLATISFFADHKVNVYVDWLDKGMPDHTSPETAAQLKEKILSNKKFVLLATPRAIKSLWVPWELGVADVAKGYPAVALFPVTEASGAYPGSEYLGLYSRIEKAASGTWAVFPPQGNGVSLSSWLAA